MKYLLAALLAFTFTSTCRQDKVEDETPFPSLTKMELLELECLEHNGRYPDSLSCDWGSEEEARQWKKQHDSRYD